MADAIKKTTKAPSKKAVEVKTLAQLQEELVKLQNDYRESRRSHQMGELVNPRVLTVQRKSIARSQTAVRQAEIAAETSALKEEN
jgi:ribosomal protein L29